MHWQRLRHAAFTDMGACMQVWMWSGLLDCCGTSSAVCLTLHCPCPDSLLLLVLLLLLLLPSVPLLCCRWVLLFSSPLLLPPG